MSILAAAIAHYESLPVQMIDVPEWGATIYYRTPNAQTLAICQRESNGNAHEFGARLVATCSMNEAGERLFNKLDYKDLMLRTDPGVLSRVAGAIAAQATLNASPAGLEDAAKN